MLARLLSPVLPGSRLCRSSIASTAAFSAWGNLTLSPSLVTTAGKAVTFTAISDTNSAQYAP